MREADDRRLARRARPAVRRFLRFLLVPALALVAACPGEVPPMVDSEIFDDVDADLGCEPDCPDAELLDGSAGVTP